MSNNPTNNPNQPTTPNTIKLGLKEKAQIGFIAVGSFFGIFHPGMVENVGAAIGEPIDKGAHDAITTTTAILKGTAEGIGASIGENQPPADPARDHLNDAVAKDHGPFPIH